MSYSLLTSESVDESKSFPSSEDSNLEFTSNIEITWNHEMSKEKENVQKVYTQTISLVDLPEEIMYLIFAFLSAHELLDGMKMVCKLFDQMLTENYFKRRMLKFLSVKETPRALKAIGLDHGEKPLNWTFACYNYEYEYDKWCDRNFKKIFRKDFSNNTSSVDIAKILGDGKLLMSGGRDRVLSLWNIEKDPFLLDFNERAHSGWIWDIVQDDNQSAFSCDWDGKIIKWSLTNSLKEPDRIFQIGRPILNLSLQDNLLVAGLQTGEICLMDPRTNTPDAILNERVQRSAVMGVEILGPTILSISEDKTLSVFDMRINKQLKKSRISSNAIPISMAIINTGLYVAQTNGTITVINTSSFKIWEVYTSGCLRLTSLKASNLGLLITASRDAKVSMYTPGKILRSVNNIDLCAEAARIDYSNGILAIARSDNKVTIYNSNILED